MQFFTYYQEFDTEITILPEQSNEEYNELSIVLSVGDGIVYASGMQDIEAGALVEIQSSNNDLFYQGMVLNLELNSIAIVLFGNDRFIRPGDIVRKYAATVSIAINEQLIGRVIDSLGNEIDGLGSFINEDTTELYAVDIKAPGIIKRKSVHEPLQTGVKAIDSMIPIGRGQRELIIGDRQTGKTTVAINTMLMQSIDNKSENQNVYNIYVGIGQKRSSIVNLVDLLKDYESLNASIIVAATASESAALQYLAPYAACRIGE